MDNIIQANIRDFRRMPRLLRQYRRVAHKDHGHCLICWRYIKIGDEYEGSVYAHNRHIEVTKLHTMCPPDFWEEEFERDAEDDRRANEAEQALAETKVAA
jgi:hypothetical protein